MEFIDKWLTHEVYKTESSKNWGLHICKIPIPQENSLRYEVAKESMEKIDSLLGWYIPKTKIIKTKSQQHNYEVQQKEIKGKTLQETPTDELDIAVLEQLQSFLQEVEEILEQGKRIDYFWYQGVHIKRKRDKNKILDLLYNLKYIIKLYIHFKWFFNSTNLMVDNQEKRIYFIDNIQHNMEDWWKISTLKKVFWRVIHWRHKRDINRLLKNR